MRIACTKFPDTIVVPAIEAVPEIKKGLFKKARPAVPGKPAVTEPSCRFYAFPDPKDQSKRVKVHVDGKVDFAKVATECKEKGAVVTIDELRKAHEG